MFRVVACSGHIDGVEQWESDDFDTMGQAVRALAKWSMFTGQAVVRRVLPDGTNEPVIAELDVPRDGSCEDAVVFTFPSYRKWWCGMPATSHLTIRGLLERNGLIG